MTSRAIIPLLLFLSLTPLTYLPLQAQEPESERIDNARRARPDLDRDFLEEMEEKRAERSFLMSLPQAAPSPALFFNSNMTIDDEPGGSLPQNESSIAINPKNPRVLISSAVDARAGMWVYISTNGGKNWRNVNLGQVHTDWTTGNDPSVAFDADGVGYAMYGAFPNGNTTGESGVYVARTTDDGQTWTAHIPVIEHVGTMTKDSAFEDKYYIEIDNTPGSPYKGYMYTPWKRVIDKDSSTQIVVSRSTDKGLTWSAPIGVSPRKHGTSTDTTFGQSFPLTTTGPDGTLYVVWNDGPSRSIGFAKSTDGGLTFSAPTYAVQGYPTLGTARKVGKDVYHVLKSTFRAETYPTIMADVSSSSRRGWLYLAWAAGRRPDIYFSRSTDKGATWSQPKFISSDTTNDQWWPWLSVDETNGDIAVMYADSRNDTANIKLDTYISYSRDGGDTWIDRRATDTMSDYRDNPYTGKIFAGDYSGNSFHDGHIYPSFLDTRRTGDNDVFTAVINLRQPYPVENLAVRGWAEQPQKATLTWTNPTITDVSTFGYPVGGYTLTVARDGNPIATLPAGTTTYSETGLTLGTNYTYSVMVVTGGDTSAPRFVRFEPFRPASPAITADGGGQRVDLQVKVPTVRADQVTPLTNLRGYRIYRDSVLIHEETLAVTDTGRSITFTDLPPARGWYRYWAAVIDTSSPVNESVWSPVTTAYYGPTTPYTLDFDAGMPKLLVSGAWGLTSQLAVTGSSLTDSPSGLYQPRLNDSVLIYPIELRAPAELAFSHIAIVHPTDSAVVEVSYDRRATWTRLASYNIRSDAAWGDTIANPGDWRRERFTLTHPSPGPGALAYVRFRLKTSATLNTDGWYLDDISLGAPAAVPLDPGSVAAGRAVVGVRAHPNPFGAAAIVEYTLVKGGSVTLEVVDRLGRRVALLVDEAQEAGPHAATFDASGLADGAYFYRLTAGGTTTVGGLVLAR